MELVRSPDLPEAAGYATAEKRYSVVLRGDMRCDALGRTLAVRIVNISAGGLMAVIPSGVEVSGDIVIEVRHLPRLTGRIAWCRDGKVGVQFDAKIDPQAVIAERAERVLADARVTNDLMRRNSKMFAEDRAIEEEDVAPFVALMRARAAARDLSA